MLGKLHDLGTRTPYLSRSRVRSGSYGIASNSSCIPAFIFIHLAEEVSEAACLGFGGH